MIFQGGALHDRPGGIITVINQANSGLVFYVIDNSSFIEGPAVNIAFRNGAVVDIELVNGGFEVTKT